MLSIFQQPQSPEGATTRGVHTPLEGIHAVSEFSDAAYNRAAQYLGEGNQIELTPDYELREGWLNDVRSADEVITDAANQQAILAEEAISPEQLLAGIEYTRRASNRLEYERDLAA